MFIQIKEELSTKPERVSTESSGASTATQRKLEVDQNPLIPFPQSTGGLSHPSSSVKIIRIQALGK